MKKNQESPSARFYRLSEYANRLTSIVGLDFLQPIFTYTPRTWLSIFVTLTCLCFTTWTVINEGLDDWRNSIKYSVIYGTGLQGAVKICTGLIRYERVKSLVLLCRDMYSHYEIKGTRYSDSLNLCVGRIEDIIRYIRKGYIISYGSIILSPFVFLLMDGSRFAVAQYFIPGVDIYTTTGYILTNGLEALSMLIAGFGLFAGDIFVLIFLSQTLVFADIFKLKIDDLNELLLLHSQRQCTSNMEDITQALYSLIEWHQHFIIYTECAYSTIYEIIATQILSSALSIIASIFALLILNGHVFFYIYLLLVIYSMLIYCFIGTKIEYTYDEIYYYINNLNWYELNLKQRKILLQVLMQTQRPYKLNILGLLPLSVRTALKVTKLIYSMTMMIMQFASE